MGSHFSCCFHPKEASDLHTEALRDLQAEVRPPVVNFYPSVKCIPTGFEASALTSSAGSLSPSLSTTSQYYWCWGIRLSSLLHVMPLVFGPKVGWRWRGDFRDFGILELKTLIHRLTGKVIKHQKLTHVRRYFWLVTQFPTSTTATPAVVTFQEVAPSPRPPVLSVAFNFFNLRTKWRIRHLERKVFPVREYLFMTTRNRRHVFIVPFTDMPTAPVKPCSMPLSSIHV